MNTTMNSRSRSRSSNNNNNDDDNGGGGSDDSGDNYNDKKYLLMPRLESKSRVQSTNSLRKSLKQNNKLLS